MVLLLQFLLGLFAHQLLHRLQVCLQLYHGHRGRVDEFRRLKQGQLLQVLVQAVHLGQLLAH